MQQEKMVYTRNTFHKVVVFVLGNYEKSANRKAIQ